MGSFVGVGRKRPTLSQIEIRSLPVQCGLKEPTARKSLSKEHETLTSQLNSEHDAELCHETSTISVRLLHLSGNLGVLYFSVMLPRGSHMGPPRPSGEFKVLGKTKHRFECFSTVILGGQNLPAKNDLDVRHSQVTSERMAAHSEAQPKPQSLNGCGHAGGQMTQCRGHFSSVVAQPVCPPNQRCNIDQSHRSHPTPTPAPPGPLK